MLTSVTYRRNRKIFAYLPNFLARFAGAAFPVFPPLCTRAEWMAENLIFPFVYFNKKLTFTTSRTLHFNFSALQTRLLL